MGKLIIHHGGRVTEHELSGSPVVIGRDPQCELFFADRKLSRQHARVEKDGARFKLVDLGSRNGSWINEERIEERTLRSGDSIRLGGLKIAFEGGIPPVVERPEETAYLPSPEPSADDSSTVVLRAPIEARSDATVSLSVAPEELSALGPDDTSTVMLSGMETVADDHADETLERPPSPESTVVLSGEPQRNVHDTGAVLLRGKVDPRIASISGTQVASVDRADTAVGDEPVETTTFYKPELPEVGPVPRVKARSWSVRFALIAAAMAVLAFLVFALPLMRTLGNALAEESKLRGRALLDVLAAANEAALGEARLADVSVNRVVDESGVSAAYVVDAKGTLVAPAAGGGRAGGPFRLEGVDADFVRLSRLTELEADNGDYIVAKPIAYRGRNVGTAVLRYRLPRGSSSWTSLVLVLGSVLMAVGVGAAVLVAKRITLSPLRELSEDVAAVRDGQASSLSLERPYSELAELARNLNDVLMARAEQARDPREDPREDRN